MEFKFINRIGFIVFILLLFTIFPSNLFAAQYKHVYSFEAPEIITLSNGRQLLKMKGTRQKDDIVGHPILPVTSPPFTTGVTVKV